MNADANIVIERLASKIGELEKNMAIAEVLVATLQAKNEQLQAQLPDDSSNAESPDA